MLVSEPPQKDQFGIHLSTYSEFTYQLEIHRLRYPDLAITSYSVQRIAVGQRRRPSALPSFNTSRHRGSEATGQWHDVMEQVIAEAGRGVRSEEL